MKKKQILVIAALCLSVSAYAYSQTSARDADIDAKMNAGSLMGVAPPTGSQALPVSPATGAQKFIDPYLPAAMHLSGVILGQTDGKARVYKVDGNVTIISKESPVEKKLKKNATIKPGDTIRTGAGASVSIAFDESYQNAVHIPQNTQALIDSIEPTNIIIENGTVFSAVDGLPQGSTWKVTTPSAVAAVRGTLYLVSFQAADGRFYSATVNVPDDGKTSAVDIQEIVGDASVDIPEGKEITLVQGQAPDDSLVKDLDPSTLDEIIKFFEELIKLREAEENVAPPTSGETTGLGVLDPAGSGVVGGENDPLDPQFDTNSIGPEPSNSMEEFSSGGDYGGEEYGGNECEWENKYYSRGGDYET